MSRQLPPLNSLRAFEAAARHLSFKKAGEDLHVTASAVSHHIKALEDFLGVPLFLRDGNSLALTPAGQAYMPRVQGAFTELVEATRHVRSRDIDAIRINVPPSFAVKWLIPRLPRFRQRHPGIDLRVSTSAELVDFARTNIDVAIRFGGDAYAGLDSEPCLPVEVFPVCAPRIVTADAPLNEPSDLSRHTLLHDDSRYADAVNPTWATWLQVAGARGVDAGKGLSFWPSHIVINAALDGLGVALAKRIWVQDDLDSGRLIRPFDISLKVAQAYHALYPTGRGNDPRVRIFLDWVASETQADAARAQAEAGAACAAFAPDAPAVPNAPAARQSAS